MMGKLAAFLGSKRLYHALLGVLIGGLLAGIWFAREAQGVDQFSYVMLAKGILHGYFSQWWDQAVPIPDTFRTPGYPLYIAGSLWLFGTWRALVAVQLIMFLLALHLTFRTLDRYTPGLVARNVLLLLLLPSVNVTVLIYVVSPEIPVLFGLAVLLWADPFHRPIRWYHAIGLGLIAAFIFQCRPIFLLFPFARLLADVWYRRTEIQWGTQAIALGTFVCMLLPFGFWNKANHGVFKVTPLEGGAGVFNLGYWCGRIPAYNERRYFWNFTADEMVRFVPKDQVPVEIAAYEREWDAIDAKIAPHFTPADSAMIAFAQRSHDRTYTFNTAYVLVREKAIMRHTLADIADHPGYYAAFKAYTLVRSWVVGIDRTRFEEGSTLQRAKLAAPFLFSMFAFLAALILVPWAHRKKLLRLRDTYPLVLVLVYWGVVHVPFAIQTRYTTSVRLVMYGLIGVAVSALLQHHRKPSNGTP